MTPRGTSGGECLTSRMGAGFPSSEIRCTRLMQRARMVGVEARPRSHHDLRMSGRAEIRIAVAPDVAYAAVADLRRMGEWSPENCGGEWIDVPAEGAVGAQFRGINRDPREEWETISTVIEAERGRRFAFRVAAPGEGGTTWRYTFEADARGTIVVETFEWHWTPLPNEGFRGRVGKMPLDEAAAAVAAKERHLQEQLDATLAALKRSLEAAPHAP